MATDTNPKNQKYLTKEETLRWIMRKKKCDLETAEKLLAQFEQEVPHGVVRSLKH